MAHLKIDPDRFKVMKEQLSRSYRNWAMDSPHQHAIYYVSHVTQERLWTHEEKLEALEDITPEMIQDFYPHLLSQLHVEGLAHGNLTEEEALKLANIVVNAFRPKPLAIAHRWETMRTHLISKEASYVLTRDVPNPQNLNSAIEYYLQVGDFSDSKLRVPLSLFSQIGSEPCFDQLRTKEQLGYMVFSGLRKQTGVIGYRVIVQSEKDAAYVESRIEAFIQKMKTVLKDMTAEEYTKHQTALAAKLLEKDKNLGQESSRHWSHINSRYYNFEQHFADAELVKQVPQEDLLKFYEEYLALESSNRRKLSVHVRSQKTGAGSTDVGNAVLQKAKLLDGEDAIAEIKSQWHLGRGATPVAPIETFFKQ
ncbi:Insulinase (Peptidase M16) [Rhizophlyctis rosea]|nr:Insulinase (Peptidase M16) [Rhizophlyctis rosea]